MCVVSFPVCDNHGQDINVQPKSGECCFVHVGLSTLLFLAPFVMHGSQVPLGVKYLGGGFPSAKLRLRILSIKRCFIPSR